MKRCIVASLYMFLIACAEDQSSLSIDGEPLSVDDGWIVSDIDPLPPISDLGLPDLPDLPDVVDLPEVVDLATSVDQAFPVDAGSDTVVVTDSVIENPDLADLDSDSNVLPPPSWPAVWITEVMSDNDSVLADASGHYPDWIELYNPGPGLVDLTGYALTDDLDEPTKWFFPTVVLMPGEYRVVFASSTFVGTDNELFAPFGLDAGGESVVLLRPDGTVAHQLDLPALPENVSYGLGQQVETTPLVGESASVRVAVFADSEWTAAEFDDSSWSQALLPIGFDGSVKDPTGVVDNAALLKPTEQSSDGYGFSGVQGIDGDLKTFSHTGDADMTPWWEVNLENNTLIESVHLYNRLDCCPERLYNITVSILDGSGATVFTSAVQNPIAAGASPVSPGPVIVVKPEQPIVGQRVRVSKVAVGNTKTSEWLSLAEVEVMGTDAAPYAGLIKTDLAAVMFGVTAQVSMRARFAPPPITPNRLVLGKRYDDAFRAWINGVPVAMSNLGPGDVVTEPHSALLWEWFTLDPSVLGESDGALAVDGVNLAADDDDFLQDVRLNAQTIVTVEPAYFTVPTPGAPNGTGIQGFLSAPLVNPERGFYDAPITITVSSGDPGATLVFTTDGSAPSPTHGTVVEPPSELDLASVQVAVSTTSLLRVATFREGFEPSPTVTHTYLFIADIIEQPAAPPGFPTVWAGKGQQPIGADYEMDPEIVFDPVYHDDLKTGLKSIPTMSIVMNNEDLFGAEKGIYIHSLERGQAWERPASVELILPDGSTGFQVNCGIRMHGWGWRPHNITFKHALRLEFRSQYGPKKLNYPLFPDAPVDKFDSIVLRSQGSRSWQDFRDPEQSQYLRDTFARDTARDMGKIDGHATFVHLYLNGLYWGLYNPVERPDAGFAAEYFGGEADDYDAINRRTTTNEAINGDLVAYNAMLALADKGLEDPVNYAEMENFLNLDDLIDYMLIHQYTVNQDGPEVFQSNNMRGIRRREPGAQFHFFVWDMEYSIWGANDSFNINVDVPGSISHVYAKLRQNPDFRKRYSDRAKLHLTNGGALTTEAVLARWEARSKEIETAIIGESARWGDAKRSEPYTKNGEWQTERNRLLTEFFPFRTQKLIEQLKAAGLWED